MQILYSSLHNLDMAQDRPVRKAIPADFNSYMDAYIKFATTENNSSREYNPIESVPPALLVVCVRPSGAYRCVSA